MTQPDETISAGAAAETDSPERIAAKFGLRFVDTVPESAFDSELIAKLPVEWARSHAVLPVRIDGEACVLTADPSKIGDFEHLSLLLGEELAPVVASPEIINSSIERCFFARRNTPEDFVRELWPEPAQRTAARLRSDDLLEAAGEAPVTQLVNLILLEAVKARASDIHFEPFESGLTVRYRIDGRLYRQSSPPIHMQSALISRLKVMAHMDIAEKRLPQDGMTRVRVGEREIDIRVSAVPVSSGERVVLRLLDRDSSLLPLADLGMGPKTLKGFEALLKRQNGLILVTGPTGSGKTTTLYAALRRLDAGGSNIMTIEDPIEYQLEGIAQIQVKPKIGLTFASGLRHILRQDPDVILIGETRDVETAETAARSSLTGHLVFTTLHTNDAPSAVVRLLDMGIEAYLLAASLRAALAQRLVRRLCTNCREQYVPGPEELEGLSDDSAAAIAGKGIFRPVGCAACLEGYKGRVGVYELMGIDGEVQDRIRMGRCSVSELRDIAGNRGMPTLESDAVGKLLGGMTSLQEVRSIVGELTK